MPTEQAALDMIAAQRYVSLMTFRTSGVGVATPVWIARSGDSLVVISVDGTGKAKRLARNPHVELRPCDIRGSVPDGAPTWSGTATLVRDPDGLAEVRAAIGRTYVMARIGDIADRLSGGRLRRTPRIGIRIGLDAGPSTE